MRFCIHYAWISSWQETSHSTPLKWSHDGSTQPPISNWHCQDTWHIKTHQLIAPSESMVKREKIRGGDCQGCLGDPSWLLLIATLYFYLKSFEKKRESTMPLMVGLHPGLPDQGNDAACLLNLQRQPNHPSTPLFHPLISQSSIHPSLHQQMSAPNFPSYYHHPSINPSIHQHFQLCQYFSIRDNPLHLFIFHFIFQ